MSQTFTDGLQTLKEVVKKALAQGRKPRSYYRPFFELAIDGYRQLRLHHVNEGKTWDKRPVDPVLKVATFPPDMEDLIGIYVPVGGDLFPLTRRDSINITTSMSGLTEILDPAKGEGVDVENFVGSGPNTRGGVNTEGYYTVEWDKRRIHLRNITATEVVILYRTSGTMIGSTTWVPNRYIPALIAFIVYEYYKYDDKYPQSRRQELLSQYQTEIIKLADLESPSLEEYMDAIRGTYYSTPRRY
jgi:hypothetical protein